MTNEIKWEVVAKTFGLQEAQIIAGRLHANEIPVRAWQESAGGTIGLTVGLLGSGYVAVPDEFADRALAILEQDADALEAYYEEEE